MRSTEPGSSRADHPHQSPRNPPPGGWPGRRRRRKRRCKDGAPRPGAGTPRHEPPALAEATGPFPAPRGVFADLVPPLQRAVAAAGYTEPSPIQTEAIPHVLAGRDLLGTAQTGSGKTAAFTLPLLQHLLGQRRERVSGRPRALVVAPTRELAAQIDQCVRVYGRYVDVRHTAIYGGVGQGPQVEALRRGVDVVVATPGRLLDLMQQGFVRLADVEVLVLDEVDRMLDMGFIHDIRKIIAALPAERQSLFFSATMGAEVTALARTLVRDPVRVAITPEQPTVERIVQKVLFVARKDKGRLLATLLRDPAVARVLVFTRLKHTANRVARDLGREGLPADAIHGNKSQQARARALAGFAAGKVRVLVATDIAARGIDVDGITHVINYDLPHEPETYVHRIGRTARAGRAGDAISFCSAEERDALRDIQRLIKTPVPVDTDHAYHSDAAGSPGRREMAAPASRATRSRTRRFQPGRRRGLRSAGGRRSG